MAITTRRPLGLLSAILLGTGLVLATTACGNNNAGPSQDPEAFFGTWGESANEQPSLTIEEDGYTGTDGCNRLAGNISIDGDTLTFEQGLSTLMACEGVDTWLSGLSTAHVVGDALEVSDEAGDVIGTLKKQ